MIWILVLILLFIFAEGGVSRPAVLNDNGRTTAKSIVLPSRICLIATLSLMAGFWGISAQDHEQYVRVYNIFRQLGFADIFADIELFTRQKLGMEMGYNAINVLGNYMGLKPPMFFMLTSLFVNICVIKFIYDYPHPVLSVFFILSMNFFLQEANLVRQIIAMAIFLISVRQLLKGNWKTYVALVFVAALFHTSAIILEAFVVFHFTKGVVSKKIAFWALVGIWGLSIMIMFGMVPFNFSVFFSDSEYSNYAVSRNSIGMEASVLNVVFHNLVAVALLLCYNTLTIKSKLFYYAVILITASTVNVSYVFTNMLRFATYFSVAFYVFTFYIFSQTENWKIDKYSIPILALQVYCAVRILVFFIIQENVFGSESYSLSDFF